MDALTRGVEVFMSINFIAIGAAYLLRPDVAMDTLARLESGAKAGRFTVALLAIGMGSFIVAFHNIWSGIPTILTVYGWIALAKGVVFLLAPELLERRFAWALEAGPGLWRLGGGVLGAVGVVVLGHALGLL